MNINDVKNVAQSKTPLKDIFLRQRELIDKYIDIEEMGDLMNKTGTNVDTKKGQLWIKEFSWRVTEELAESFEPVMEAHLMSRRLDDDEVQHYFEELADALHFFVEMAIIAGLEYSHFQDQFEKKWPKVYIIKDHVGIIQLGDIGDSHWRTVYKLGLMCNTLKNKRWKQTQMLTDRPKFNVLINQAFGALIGCFKMAGLNEDDIYNFYFKKSEVNKFRQRTKY